MPIYWLPQDPVFPDPRKDGVEDLVAVGGDLGTRRLVQAYSQGIFPWYERGSPILWWSPDPRLILEPERLHVPRRLERLLRREEFTLSLDLDFEGVISSCASVHLRRAMGTWILPEMITAYCRLHEQGYAHSLEVWREGELVGGIYGVALKRAFFGESMFHRETNASKVALVSLMRVLHHHGFHFLDCQQTTTHLLQFGAREVSRGQFLNMLDRALADPRGEPDLRPGYLRTEDRGQKTEDRGQKTEDRCQRTDDRRQMTEDRGQKTEDRGQKTEDRRQRTEDRRQMSEDRRRRPEDLHRDADARPAPHPQHGTRNGERIH